MDIKSMFPKGSDDFFKANLSRSEYLDGTKTRPTPKNDVAGQLGGKKRGSMNKTETEYSMILEAEKRAGKIERYQFEGITLRFAGVKYTPDFVVFTGRDWAKDYIKLIEIKGRYIKGHFERAIERFRHARTYYPEFWFEMHQKQKGGWKQIL